MDYEAEHRELHLHLSALPGKVKLMLRSCFDTLSSTQRSSRSGSGTFVSFVEVIQTWSGQWPAGMLRTMVMQTVDEILEHAKRLSADDRRKLVDALQEDVAEEQGGIDDEAKRLAAFDRFLSRAGTGHSEYTDVARDKYKHLDDVYSDKK